MLLWLVACAARAPMTVYPAPIPELGLPPAPVPFEPATDECPSAEPIRPGETRTHDCRATLVPESQVVRWVQLQDDGVWWERRAKIVQDGRELDRAQCQAAVDLQHLQAEALRREATTNRWLVPAGVVLGLLGGVVVGYGAGVLP